MENEEDHFSDSSMSSDMTPVFLHQFQSLSDSLKETNQNLNTFEYLFGNYKKLVHWPSPQVKNDDKIQTEIMAELHGLRSELLQRQNHEAGSPQENLTLLKETIQELRERLSHEEIKCKSLIDTNRRLNHALDAERQRYINLEQRVEAETIARQEAEKNIEVVKTLEAKIANLQENRLDTSSNPIEDCTFNESLCKTCICHHENPLESVVERVDQLARDIESRNRKIVGELKKAGEEAIKIKPSDDSSSRGSSGKAKLKLSLAELIAERDSLLCFNHRFEKKIKHLEAEAREREARYQALKHKCKGFLTKYRSHADDRRKYSDKLGIARRALVDLQRLCKMKDENHGILMNYFGGQIEIGGRLLAAFVGSDYQGPILATEKHKKLAEWFCSVHSVSVWTQKQILALGEQLINDDQASLSIAMNRDTLSDISISLARDHGLPLDVMRALQNEAAVLQQTKENVDELRNVLELENS